MTPPPVESTPQVAPFRPAQDWFVVEERDGLVHCVAWAPAERLVRTTLTLLEQLDPAVDVVMESARDGRAWAGEQLSLGEVRLALAGLQRPLVTHGGVEVSVYTPEDQITLTSSLLLVLVSRSYRWTYLLEASGFEQRERVPSPEWDPAGVLRRPAPALATALEAAAAALALEPRYASA